MKPTGSHSATRKGDNGKVSPKANGQTTEKEVAPPVSGGDASSWTIVSRA